MATAVRIADLDKNITYPSDRELLQKLANALLSVHTDAPLADVYQSVSVEERSYNNGKVAIRLVVTLAPFTSSVFARSRQDAGIAWRPIFKRAQDVARSQFDDVFLNGDDKLTKIVCQCVSTSIVDDDDDDDDNDNDQPQRRARSRSASPV